MRLIMVAVCATLVLAVGGCVAKESERSAAPKSEALLVGLATGTVGLGDKSFNDMQYTGLVQAKKLYGIDFTYAVPETTDKDYEVIEGLVKRGCKVVIGGGGWHMVDPIDALAAKYPDVKFVLLDSPAKSYPPNVCAIVFRQNEGSFLAGALAALVSKTKKICVLGAVKAVVIDDFMVGFEQGARYVDPGIDVMQDYIERHVPKDVNAFGVPNETKALSAKIYARGYDVIFPVASASGGGTFVAAREAGAWAIGVDSDQDYMAEGSVLTSMMKHLDQSVVFILGEIVAGRFANREYVMGLKEGGVGLSPMTYTRDKVGTEVMAALESIRRKIIAGEIEVATAYK